MRLSNLIIRLRRRNRLSIKQASEDAPVRRELMTLETISRAAQSRSLRGNRRPH